MADLTGKPISELTGAGAKSWANGANDMDSDLFAISRPGDGGSYSRKLTGQQLREFVAPLKTFYSVAQIGQTSGNATITATWTALPNNTIGVFDAAQFASAQLPDSTTTGYVLMIRSSAVGRGLIQLSRKAGDYIMHLDTINGQTVPDGKWRKNTDCYVAGDTVSGSFLGVGRVVNAGDKLYMRIDLDKPISAASFAMTVSSCNIYTADGAVTYDSNAAIVYSGISRNTVLLQLPFSGTKTGGTIGIAEIGSATITFS